METALTSYLPSMSGLSADTVRQGTVLPADRSNSQAANSRDSQNRSERSSRTPDVNSANRSRVISGEVLSSETYRVSSQSASQNLLRPSVNDQQTSNSEPDPRRLSMPQAIQNFEQNEAMGENQTTMRQVSGIIDLFV